MNSCYSWLDFCSKTLILEAQQDTDSGIKNAAEHTNKAITNDLHTLFVLLYYFL